MKIDIHRLPDVRGKTVAEAQVILESHGVNSVRVKMRDGKPLIVSADHKADRLNVVESNGLISSVIAVG